MPLAADPFLATLALVGAVIAIAALLSGLIERSGLPQVGVLLALGAVLGPYGLGLIDPTIESPVLRAVARGGAGGRRPRVARPRFAGWAILRRLTAHPGSVCGSRPALA